MTRLLKEGLSKARVSKRFWVCTFIIIGLSLLSVILYKSIPNSSTKADGVLFNMLGNQSLFMAIVPAMLLVRDFTQNTVRNKIICGHSRTHIYLAHIICFDIVAVYYHVVSMASALLFGIPILGGADTLAHGYVLYYVGISFLLILAYASLTMFICMLMRSVSGVIIAYVINSLLSTFAMIAVLIIKDIKLYDLVTCCILDMQAQEILGGIAEKEYPRKFVMYAMPLCSLAYIIGLPIIGIRAFRKADLK